MLAERSEICRRHIQMHTVRFTEPYITPEQGIDFVVTEKFYKVLAEKPKSDKLPSEWRNGYVFGKKYPLNEYMNLGYWANDGAQIGLIDVADKPPKQELASISDSDKW